MRTKGVAWAVAAVLGVLSTVGPAGAESNPNGMVFRAVGWLRGKAEVSESSITCEIPTSESGIADGAFSMGLWNTYGEEFLYFPDVNRAFANPCGGWLHLRNNLLDQGINVERVRIRYRIPGSRRLRQFVPTRNGFPIACRPFRKQTLFVGARLEPANSTQKVPSGLPNSAVIQLLPLVNNNVVNCLRSQYGPLPADVVTSLLLKIVVTADGVSDAGGHYTTNALGYALSLRHTCGNGRRDDGEICDPTAPNTCVGFCIINAGDTTGICSGNDTIACRSDVDCFGTCLDGSSPSECTCVY
jgi:hypothetical protein